ncbi:hypothetical protein ACWOA0_07680 [Ignavigranum ruoffiae]|uniref:Ethanolamine utilization protein n=1 Tax=Ignavigranum ruoffiae TaxID=89093 RepID=A0A1H9CDY0_9LACT|nr:hypothetical protein [Ignavigranum ruoffiae]SEP99354.1 hypothetical protein SAMN04488558_1044 [Ignavigranum ruoffiae]
MNSDELVRLVTEKILEQLKKESSKRFLALGKTLDISLDVDITNDPDELLKSQGIIVKGLGWESLFRLKNLVSITQNEEVIIKGLLEDKLIILIRPTNWPKNKLMISKAEETLRDLKRMGLVFLHEEELNNYINSQGVKEQQSFIGQPMKTKKKLVTVDILREEYDLKQLTEFKKEPNMIITALAKDYLQENNIKLI